MDLVEGWDEWNIRRLAGRGVAGNLLLIRGLFFIPHFATSIAIVRCYD